MAEQSKAQFNCPSCGKRYPWKSAWAGKKVRCECGAKLKLPPAPGGQIELLQARDSSTEQPPSADPAPAEGGTYELNIDDDSPSPAPQSPDNPDAAETGLNPYELDFDEEPAEKSHAPAAANVTGQAQGESLSPANHCPQCGSKMKHGAVVCVQCGYHVQTGTALETDVSSDPPASPDTSESSLADGQRSLVEQQAEPDEPAYVNPTVAAARREQARKAAADREAEAYYHRLNVTYPRLMFLSCPVVLLLGLLLLHWTMPHSHKSLLDAVIGMGIIVGVELLVMTPLLLLAVMISATLLKLEFGNLRQVLYKCASICVGPGMIADVIALPIFGLTLGFLSFMLLPFFIYLTFIGVPLSKIFDLDIQETMMTVTIVVFVRLGAFLIGATLAYKLFF